MDERLWGLGGVAKLLYWLESLVVMASGPVLTFGLGVGLVALLTDGQLLVSAPWLLYAWGVGMAVGVDGQLVGAAVKLGRSFRAQKWGQSAGYLIMIGALSYVAYLAAVVFATSQADGISTARALTLLGMDKTAWIIQRSVVVVGLVILSGVLRYDPTKAVAETAEQRHDRMQRELEDAQHKKAKRALEWGGWGEAARAAVDGAKQSVSTAQDDAEPPANDGSNPGVYPVETSAQSGPLLAGKAGGMRGRGIGRQAVPSDTMSAPQFRQYLAENGVVVSSEKAVALVQSVPGYTKVGTSYCAKKAPLMRLANRLIERAQASANASEEQGALVG